jgi:galactose mutarotase-like enzyme
VVGERIEDGFAALTLESGALGGLEAIFVPEAGMICCSLRHRGEELLGQRDGLTAYVGRGSTMGIPFLHPWANRLGTERFEVAGAEVDLTLDGLHVKRDGAGLPIHGLLAAAGWRVLRHSELEDGGLLAAGFDFGDHPLLAQAFPFSHRVEIEASLRGAELRVATVVEPTGETSVPISFGFHPYLRLPGVARAEWVLEAPVRERLALDERMLPTGEREDAPIATGPLGSRTFDDPYVAPADGADFALSGGGRRLRLSLGEGYRFTQLYAPAGTDAVAIEPMTAPTNALVAGGPDLPLLAPGERYSAVFTLRIEETASPR